MKKINDVNISAATLDGCLARLRTNEPGSIAYVENGKQALSIILSQVLPDAKTLEDSVEIYYLRLRCHGHREIIRVCEAKILEIVSGLPADALGEDKLKGIVWFEYWRTGFNIFSEEISLGLKTVSKKRTSA